MRLRKVLGVALFAALAGACSGARGRDHPATEPVRPRSGASAGATSDAPSHGPGEGSRSSVIALHGARSTIAAGLRGVCAIRGDAANSVWCWEPSSPPGSGTQPAPVPDTSGTEELVATVEHFCARSALGRVRCWHHSSGQVHQLAGVWHGIAATTIELCALDGAGSVRCWRAIDADPRRWDTRSPLADRRVAELSGGCAVDTEKRVACWDTFACATPDVPLDVPIPSLTLVISVHAREQLACALRESGEVYCWGSCRDEAYPAPARWPRPHADRSRSGSGVDSRARRRGRLCCRSECPASMLARVFAHRSASGAKVRDAPGSDRRSRGGVDQRVRPGNRLSSA